MATTGRTPYDETKAKRALVQIFDHEHVYALLTACQVTADLLDSLDLGAFPDPAKRVMADRLRHLELTMRAANIARDFIETGK